MPTIRKTSENTNTPSARDKSLLRSRLMAEKDKVEVYASAASAGRLHPLPCQIRDCPWHTP